MAKQPWIKARFDIVEMVLLAGVVALVMWAWTAQPNLHWEADVLAEEYGPDTNSQYAEEWIIRDFFGDKRHGTFVDIGAANHRINSNTYYLETALGWSGIAVDAQETFADEYAANRPRTKFFAFFVGERTGESAQLWLSAQGSRLASATRYQAEQRAPASAIEVPTIRLDDLLDSAGIREFDFLSMDIELAEPTALAGFSIDRFRPALVCVEAHLPTRQAVLEYFAQHDYVLVGKYLRADEWNLYFTPRQAKSTGHRPASQSD